MGHPPPRAPDWLVPSKRCPNCGSPPAVQIPRSRSEQARRSPPEHIEISVQCAVGWCRTIYVVRSEHYANAS